MLEQKDQDRRDYTHALILGLFLVPGLFLSGEMAERFSWRESALEMLAVLVAVSVSAHISSWLKARDRRRSGEPVAEEPVGVPDRPLGPPLGLASLPLILGYTLVLILVGLAGIWVTEFVLRHPSYQDLLPFIPALLLAFFLTNLAFKRLLRRSAEKSEQS